MINKLLGWLGLAKKPKTVTQVLDVIDEFLAYDEDYTARMELWHILTALRGPDIISSGAGTIKGLTTEVFRSLAFPKVARSNFYTANFASKPNLQLCDLSDKDVEEVGEHFNQHAKVAAQALKSIGRSR